jgi:hypothetical protein
MPFIPRQVKPPARIALTCKVPQAIATLLKCYAEFLDSSQEHVVTETLRVAFRRDREFQAWLSTAHPEIAGDTNGVEAGSDPPSDARPLKGHRPTTGSEASRSAATRRPALGDTVVPTAKQES